MTEQFLTLSRNGFSGATLIGVALSVGGGLVAENKFQNINALITELIEHTVAIEAENFYFRSALSFAKANPTEYGLTALRFEQCLAIVQAAPERFDHSSARASAERLHELVHRLVPPESQ